MRITINEAGAKSRALEERLARLETIVNQHAALLNQLTAALAALEALREDLQERVRRT
jgi:hypothetical protein